MAKLSINKDELTTKVISTEGIYDLQFKGFRPKRNKAGDSVNLNPYFEVINDPVNQGVPVFFVASMKMPSAIQDFVHAFGFTMLEGSSPDEVEIPGDWDMPEQNKPETWKYTGPLSGRVIKALLMPTDYQGRAQTGLKAFICAVENCPSKYPGINHSKNLLK